MEEKRLEREVEYKRLHTERKGGKNHSQREAKKEKRAQRRRRNFSLKSWLHNEGCKATTRRARAERGSIEALAEIQLATSSQAGQEQRCAESGFLHFCFGCDS